MALDGFQSYPAVTNQQVTGSEWGLVTRNIGAGPSGSNYVTGVLEGQFYEPVPVYVYDTGSYFFGSSQLQNIPAAVTVSSTIGVLWHPAGAKSLKLNHIEFHSFANGGALINNGQYTVLVSKVTTSGTGGGTVDIEPGIAGQSPQTVIVTGSINPVRNTPFFVDGITERYDGETIINFETHPMWIMAGEAAGFEVRTYNKTALTSGGPSGSANFAWEEF